MSDTAAGMQNAAILTVDTQRDNFRVKLTVSSGDDVAGGVGVGVRVLDGGGVGGHGDHSLLGGAGGHDDVAHGAEGLEGADVLQKTESRTSVLNMLLAWGSIASSRRLAADDSKRIKRIVCTSGP